MQQKNVHKFPVARNKFLYHLAMFWMVIKKHTISYKSLALVIIDNINPE